MKNKILLAVLAVILVIAAFPAGSAKSSGMEAGAEAEKILEYERGLTDASSNQEYVNVGLVPYAGISPTEWVIISLKQSGNNLDYSGYVNALHHYLDTTKGLKATDYQRIAMALSALNMDQEWVEQVIDTYTGQFGIMSYIYGLQLKEARNYTTRRTAEEMVQSILQLQKSDGGFTIAGNYGDADVTAMALQALAPYKAKYAQQINLAVNRLSALQKNSGGYASMGLENAESTAQVLLALQALGMDYRTAPGFIKNGKTVMDGLLQYKNPDGGYAHVAGGKTDGIATIQAYNALCGQNFWEQNKRFYYQFEILKPEVETTIPETSAGTVKDPETTAVETESQSAEATKGHSEGETDTMEETTSVHDSETSSSHQESVSNESETPLVHLPADESKGGMGISGSVIKACIMAVVAAIFLIWAFFRILGRKWKSIFFATVAVLFIGLELFLGLSQIETVSEHYGQTQAGTSLTYISIQGFDHTILKKEKVSTQEKISAFHQLELALNANGIPMDYTGSALFGTIYIRSINGLAEFDHGSNSGWIYKVNGISPKISAGSYTLKKGDVVEWIYTDGGDTE